jgi:hypothetical protein
MSNDQAMTNTPTALRGSGIPRASFLGHLPFPVVNAGMTPSKENATMRMKVPVTPP